MKTIFQRDKITEPALFTPVDTTKKIENFPEICVSTFSEKIIQKFSSLKDVEKIAELYTANGAMPVYKMRYKNQEIAFYLSRVNHAFIKALRHTQRPSVKGFVPYLVKLSVALIPLLKVSVFPFHLPKLKEKILRYFQFMVFPLPVLEADKIPCSAFRGFLPKRVRLSLICHPSVLLPKNKRGDSTPHPVARRIMGCIRRLQNFPQLLPKMV